MSARTVADAGDYWERYYSDAFTPGLGTEDILAALQTISPVHTWVDAGAGSESLLWAIPLTAAHLVAADIDTDRLALLRSYAAAQQPRPAYRTVLQLCGRTERDFAARCRTLAATVRADCLTGRPLPIAEGSVDLLTQFGLLGLTATPDAFVASWQALHRALAPGGWCAGANWVSATTNSDRVSLSEELYRQAMTACGITPHLLTRVPITGDPDFTAVWIYVGRTP
ncbi:class I SAM-dependent methyltransferase [Streptosporangium sp. CA-115845]|uniref:class I SAM-dependent methyltransferase n=1 Tax=Streptosporangium sp. CA-115845 TaxID=3240071 RepID=UPI003D8A41F5